MGKKKEQILEELGGEESFETSHHMLTKTGYPKPLTHYRLVFERPNLAMEEAYYFVLKQVQNDWGFPQDDIEKLEDVFSAAENSAFFGVSQQRLGLQQDKVSQFLATIGKMVKELFQLVREIRILDERMEYYEDSNLDDRKLAEPAEITLKGIFIDMVEGGAKNPSSVYGMSRELQFTTLPDLFFSTHPKKKEEVEKVVDVERGGFNRKVREVLKRKLYSYIVWKVKTYDELKSRRIFTIKYLRQHYDIIKMYMHWVRPYLRHIKRLHMDDKRLGSPDLISAFEGSMIEIEFLAKKFAVNAKSNKQNKKMYTVIIAHFLYRTTPSMSFQQEGYQRGPIHVGKVEINIRSYVWTKEKCEKYKQLKDQEDLELLESVSGSVKAAMEALGDELEKYLTIAGEENLQEFKKEEKKESGKPVKREGLLTPFISPFMNIGPKKPKMEKPKKKTGKDIVAEEDEKSEAKKEAKSVSWECYKNFKKAHGLLAW